MRHNITRTRPTGDGGFDFVGSFTLPPPIQYEIPFLGEAKRFARSTGVGPKDVSRLVARLSRGQYWIFVTTSYFTKQAQEEVLEDRYPTSLLAGADLVRDHARVADRSRRRDQPHVATIGRDRRSCLSDAVEASGRGGSAVRRVVPGSAKADRTE